MSEPPPCRHFMLSGERQADGTVRYRCHHCRHEWQVTMSDTSMFPAKEPASELSFNVMGGEIDGRTY
jgi:transposase-like protein